MIRKIVLENFMTHKHTVIELADGLTVLSGPNNVGKSAVVEAIRCICDNPPAAFVVRHNADKAVVTLELDSGVIIKWERTPKSSLYRIIADGNEEVYSKLQGNVPEDVQRLLRIGMLDTQDDKLDIHIGHQKNPIFLLNESGSRVASFFAASTEAEYLVKMRQALKDKTRLYRDKEKELIREIAQYKSLLEKYEPLGLLQQDLETCEKEYEWIINKEREILQLSELIHGWESIEEREKSLSCFTSILFELAVPPDVRNTPDLKEMIEIIEGISNRIKHLVSEDALLTFLTSPPELKETINLALLFDEMHLIKERATYGKTLRDILECLDNPPELKDTAFLNDLWKDICNLMNTCASIRCRLGILDEVKEPPRMNDTTMLAYIVDDMSTLLVEIEKEKAVLSLVSYKEPSLELKDVDSLESCISEYRRILQEIDICSESIENIGRDLDKKKREIGEFLEKIRICPVCNQKMDLEHFIEESHNGTKEI